MIIKKIIKLFAGNFAIQIISLIAMPITTRLYAPSELGIYQYIATTALIASPFLTLSLTEALILEKNQDQYDSLFITTIKYSLISSVIISLIFYFFEKFNNRFDSDVAKYSVLFFFLMASSSIFVSYQSDCIRNKRYGKYSLQGIKTSVIGNISKILLGFGAPSASSLLFSQTIGFVVVMVIPLITNKTKIYKSSLSDLFDVKNIINKIIEQKNFTFYLTLSNFLGIFMAWSIVIFAPNFGSFTEVGILSLAIMAINTPFNPVIQSIEKIAYAEGSGLIERKKDIYSFYIKIIIFGLVLGISIFVTILIFGEFLFQTIFGEKWIESATYATYLSIPISISFVLFPYYQSLAKINKKQNIIFIINIISSAILGVLFFLCSIYESSLKDVVIINSLTMSLIHVSKFIAIFKVTRRFL